MSSITYHHQSNFLVRFKDHAKIGLSADIGPNRPEANLCEKAGNQLLKITELPIRVAKGVVRKMQDPRYVTVALTAMALLANSAIFYPTQTKELAQRAVVEFANLLKNLDLFEWTRFGTYATSCLAITGYGLRAEGRFTNQKLMQHFYGTLEAKKNPAGMTHAEIQANR